MNRVVVITGTRKGIGRGLAEHYLEGGWTVAGCSRGPSDLRHECYSHFEVDITDERAVTSMVRRISRRLGRIDGLLNNAGIAAMNHLLLTPGTTARRVLETNFLGSFFVLREVGKIMVRKKAGRIVNFSTVAVPLDLEGEAIYAASKAAVESLTRVAAREFGGFGVTVNAVGPTPVPTDLTKTVPRAKIDALLARQAIPRLGSIEDVANVTDYLLNPAGSFLTGQVLYLGGVRD